ncbi:MAG: YdcF family protein [Bacteroidales bacterium]|nr:YdcF family protein [Bacteroidales bacterium]
MSSKDKLRKRMLWIFVIAMCAVLAVVLWCQLAVVFAAKGRMYSDTDKIPHREVGLLLGTNPTGRTGRPNQFFLRRIDATVDLYKSGKIDRLILSGAKRGPDIDEPEAMRNELISRGVPDSILTLDGRGYRTINSILNAKKVYGVDSCTIISQRFHNQRTLYLTSHLGVDAIAYNAAHTSSRRWKLLMMGRECFARVKAVFEMKKHKK